MRKLLAVIIVISLCLSMGACGQKEEPKNEKQSFQGTSDGTFSFTEGNIKFTIPEGQFYTVSQNESDSGLSLTMCGFGIGDSTTTISAFSAKDMSEAEVIEKLDFWNDMDEKDFADHTRFDDMYMNIMGQEAIFKTYLNEAEENPYFYMVTNFTDSHYIYLVEIKLRAIEEAYYMPVFEMVTFSEYTGQERRFEFFQ